MNLTQLLLQPNKYMQSVYFPLERILRIKIIYFWACTPLLQLLSLIGF